MVVLVIFIPIPPRTTRLNLLYQPSPPPRLRWLRQGKKLSLQAGPSTRTTFLGLLVPLLVSLPLYWPRHHDNMFWSLSLHPGPATTTTYLSLYPCMLSWCLGQYAGRETKTCCPGGWLGQDAGIETKTCYPGGWLGQYRGGPRHVVLVGGWTSTEGEQDMLSWWVGQYREGPEKVVVMEG